MVVDLFADTAKARGLLFDCRIDPTVPHFVRGDPGRLRQILSNLVSNALKFTRMGSVHIRVSSRVDGERQLVTFAIRDTGVGIPDEKRKLLFRPFSQADSSTTREFGGTGLGLAISRRLAELMGGTIGVVSEPGSGSTFSFELPFADPTAAAPALGLDVSPFVVIVDGADTEWESLEARLTGLGVAVRRAASAAEGMDVLAGIASQPRMLVLPLDSEAAAHLDALTRKKDLTSVQVLMTSKSLEATILDTVAPHPRFGASLRLPVRGSTLRKVLNGLCTPTASPTKRDRARVVIDGTQANRSGRILLVEDNQINQRVACRMLERLGHAVHVAGNGLEALAVLQVERFDLVLMDCQMPEMDGFEATQHIRAGEGADRRLPIVAMTANAMQGDREQCLRAGMDDYLSKPVRTADLAAMLNRWLAPEPKA